MITVVTATLMTTITITSSCALAIKVVRYFQVERTYLVIKVTLCQRSKKVKAVKELMGCDVSHLAMFFSFGQ